MSQPACTAIQLALVDLLTSWGVRPKAVVGHSSGEIAAAYAAGILSLEECVRVAYCRGVAANLLMKDETVQGAMLAVGANAGDIQQILDAMRGKQVVIACVNSESSVTLSGDREAIGDLQAALDKEGIFTRKLHVDVAYHSHHMAKVAPQYRSLIGKIAPRTSEVPFHSTVKGKLVPGATLDASYWVENLVSRVEFVKGVNSLLTTDMPGGPIDTIIEVGPHHALQGPTKDIAAIHAPNRTLKLTHTLKRKVPGDEAVQQLAATLFTQGMNLDFQAINFPNLETVPRKPQLLTNLPKYPWNHTERYWTNSRLGDNLFHQQFPRNDILGKRTMENIDLEPRWRNIIRADDHPWIRQHRVHDSNVYPMTGFLAMAMEAMSQQAHIHHLVPGKIDLREISISRVLPIPDSSTVETMLSLRPVRADAPGKSILGWHEFKVFSWAEGRGWDEHCSGFVMVSETKDANAVNGLQHQANVSSGLIQLTSEMHASCTTPIDSDVFYEDIASGGVNYGPLFRNLSNISVSTGRQAMGTICVPDTKGCMPNEHETAHLVHPVTLDLCSQMMWALFGYGQPGSKVTHVPSHVKHVSLSLDHNLGAGAKLQLYGQDTRLEPASMPVGNRIIATTPDDSSRALIEIQGITLVPITNDIMGSKDKSPDQICYKLHWEPCFDFLSENTYRELPRAQVGDGKGNERMHLVDSVADYWLRQMLCSVSESELSSFEPHHQKFYRWAQQSCKEGGIVNDLSSEVVEHTRNMNGAGKVTCVIGERLPEILRGKVDALAMLLEDDMLGGYYQDLDGVRESYSNASVCIDKMAHQNPEMNILEIGAGTGGATLPILQTLGGHEAGSTPRFGHYTYTDISPGFFEKAKTKFDSWGHLMTYQVLDVSTDPIEQGFKLGTYDVVVACNVLHATSDINQTMANIRALMKPGGKIMLIEETCSRPRHFPFALLPGWWLASEDIRQSGPLLTKEGWNEVMKANDFSGVDLCIEEFPGASHQAGCLIMTTANPTKSGPTNPGDIVVIGNETLGCLSTLSLEAGLKESTGVVPKAVSGLESTDLTGKWCIFLGGLDQLVLADLTPEKYQAFQRLVGQARGLLWPVRHWKSDPRSLGVNMVIGLARTVRSETGLQFATLDLGEKESMSDAEAVQHMLHVFNGVFCQKSQLMHGDFEFVVRNGHVCVPRLLDNHALNLSVQLETTPDAPPQLQNFKQKERPLRLTAGLGRVLDELYFTDDAVRDDPLPEDYLEIRVCCTGLNFRDVLMAMGQLQGNKLGQECSGIVTKVGSAVTNFSTGDRVSAMSPGSLATYTRCPASCAWVIPYDMSFSVAASIPAVFCTAYYSLIDLGRLEKGESVLIHAAAGGVGQAAIIIAQSLGAKVYATVGSVEKKNFLMETYQLKEDEIFFSRDTSFVAGIRHATGGEGVDVALNSLSGDALQATFECIAPFGRFIELGKRDICQNSRLEMSHFNHNVSFASVDLGIVREKRPKLTKRLMRNAFNIFIDTNAQKRWPVTTLPISQVETGFRALQSGTVIGKMVVEMTDDSMVKVCNVPHQRERTLANENCRFIQQGRKRSCSVRTQPILLLVERVVLALILLAGCRRRELSILFWSQEAELLLSWPRGLFTSSLRMVPQWRFAAQISPTRRVWIKPWALSSPGCHLFGVLSMVLWFFE